MKVLKTIVTLFKEYKPFLFFSLAAVLLWGITLMFFLPVLWEYFQTGKVPRFPTVIISGVVATFGILLWICGVILDVMIKKHRQLYELYLNYVKEK